jgi:hypothetical protein
MKPAGNFLIAAAILQALEGPHNSNSGSDGCRSAGHSRGRHAIAVLGPLGPAQRRHHWGDYVNTGSTIIARFQGTHITLHFTTTQYSHQFPSLWLQVDEGEWKVVRPAEELRISPTALPAGSHVVRLVVKGFREWENRWDTPLVGSVVFRGVTPDDGTQLLPAPERPAKLVEFLGDSITEGVLVLNTGPRETWTREKWPEFSDGRRSWSYQSALLAGAEPRTVGFGRLGLSINANGGVPPALHSFPFVYSGAPVDKTRLPDAVVINMGPTMDSGSQETCLARCTRLTST